MGKICNYRSVVNGYIRCSVLKNGYIKHAEEVEEGTNLLLHRTVALCLFIYVVVSVLIIERREGGTGQQRGIILFRGTTFRYTPSVIDIQTFIKKICLHHLCSVVGSFGCHILFDALILSSAIASSRYCNSLLGSVLLHNFKELLPTLREQLILINAFWFGIRNINLLKMSPNTFRYQ